MELYSHNIIFFQENNLLHQVSELLLHYSLFPKALTSIPLNRYLSLPDVLNTTVLFSLQSPIFQLRDSSRGSSKRDGFQVNTGIFSIVLTKSSSQSHLHHVS